MRPRKDRHRPKLGAYCGLPLQTWREAVRTVIACHWHIFSLDGPADGRSAERHAAVVSAATLLLPVSWHTAHKGRLSPDFYASRRAMLALWSPRLPRGQVSG